MQPNVSGKFISVEPHRNSKLQCDNQLNFQVLAAKLTRYDLITEPNGNMAMYSIIYMQKSCHLE